MTARLASGVWVSALVRRVNAAGGFATVLTRGDAVAGSIVVVHRDRGAEPAALMRAVGPSGESEWRVAARGDSLDDWLDRQRGYDPDLWVLELDIPDLARFID